MITELNRGTLVLGEQVTEQLSSLHERQPPHIGPVQEQEIESKHHQPVRSAFYGGSQSSEIREAILVLDNDLTVNQGRPALELAAGRDQPAVLVAPVVTATGEGTDVATI